MRFLGIDYGTKRVGLALSDENGFLAFPFIILSNTKNLLGDIADILKKENVQEVVVGESRNEDNSENKINKGIEKFIFDIEKKFNLKVHREKEFFSSYEAHSKMGKEVNNARQDKFSKTENIDSKAAAIILQRFLDRRNR
jgi:putative holliday junction resolvase